MNDVSEDIDAMYLEVRGLECIRSGRVLFTDLGFTLQPGEAVQVGGANGSGKTSLLRILCGLSLPEDGEILWRGNSIHKCRDEYLAEVSYVGHNHGVKSDLTAVENLRIANALGCPNHDISLEDALDKLGLIDIDVPVRTLSAGQRRRVALARTMVNKSRLWILDEPFTALDKEGRQVVENLLAEHLRHNGMLVLTTHQLMELPINNLKQIHTGI